MEREVSLQGGTNITRRCGALRRMMMINGGYDQDRNDIDQMGEVR